MGRSGRELDSDALALFARKGLEAGPGAAQIGEANGPKVRRVMQLVRDLAGPFEGLRILDLGCGEGVYAIEAGLAGARVLAVDGRMERMRAGADVARRHGLDRVAFRQADVRVLDDLGERSFDVVLCLGLLYHLDAPDAFALLERAFELCRACAIVDTNVSLEPDAEVEHRGERYRGERVREHEDDDPSPVRLARTLRSLDNAFAFRFAKEALVRALSRAGFSSVLECHAPPEPGKAANRVTLAALRGQPVAISTYPWVNGMSESDLERRLGGS